MTREEAISQLDLCKSIIYASGQDWLDERDIAMLDMAIEALQESKLDEISNAYENGYQQGKFEGRKTGKWIRHPIYSGSDHYYYACSECDYRSWSKDNYCSVCGAKMEE